MALNLIPIRSGTREKQWPLPDGGHLICRYQFFSILADDCQVASAIKWYISAGPQRKEITYDQVKQLFPNHTPRVGIWEHYALIIIIGVALLVLLFEK